jgi:hypothetical protein
MQSELDRLIEFRAEFEIASTAVHEMLIQRLETAKIRLAAVLNPA